MNNKLTIAEMNRLTAEAFHQADKLPLTIVLDNVRSQHNIGAVFRTADAFLLEKICLCGICCCPPNDEIHKTALGAELTVDWQYFKDTKDAVNALHQKGYKVYAIEQVHNSIRLEDEAAIQRIVSCKEPIAIIFGHEVFGVQQEVINLCDGCIEITQYGTKHSLNVSVTAGIAMHRLSSFMRQR
ncbi:MAG: TrmH family RNA methyltransferase [Paludibacteraceae bacterium]|nr:TrmH family RNA methyltransferase [Paludibacteraceae bacterium]